jgi:hypothetical protein
MALPVRRGTGGDKGNGGRGSHRQEEGEEPIHCFRQASCPLDGDRGCWDFPQRGCWLGWAWHARDAAL